MMTKDAYHLSDKLNINEWKFTKLKRVTSLLYGESLSSEQRVEEGNVDVFGSNGIVGKHSAAITKSPCIIIGRKGSFGKINYSETPCYPIDTTYYIDETATSNDLRYIFYLLQSLGLDQQSRDSAVPGLNREEAYQKECFIPTTISEQKKIANYLDCKTAQIDSIVKQKELFLKSCKPNGRQLLMKQ